MYEGVEGRQVCANSGLSSIEFGWFSLYAEVQRSSKRCSWDLVSPGEVGVAVCVVLVGWASPNKSPLWILIFMVIDLFPKFNCQSVSVTNIKVFNELVGF